MGKLKFAAIAVALLTLAGCQTMSQPVKREVVFSSEEYAKLEKTGTSSISGQLFLRTRGGDVKYGAGSEVVAAPVTRYSREATYIFNSGRTPEPADPRASAYTHRTIADGAGRFQFDELAAGSYFIVGAVYWEIPVRYAPLQGGVVIKEVTVEDGEDTEIMLTK